MKVRLVRPWILFPYKSLKILSSSNFDTFAAMTLKLQEVGDILSCDANYSFYSCLCTIKIRTPFCIGSIVID